MDRNLDLRPTVALIGAEHEENLSLRYLAATVERAGFRAELVVFTGEADPDEITSRVLASGAIVAGISVPFQLRARELLGLSDQLRAGGFAGHVCVGGHFATFEYENVLRDFSAIDSVVRHEGEAAFLELCQLVRDGAPMGALPGLVVRQDGRALVGAKRPLPLLDSLPFPDRRGAPADVLGVPAAPIIGSRGCYADCSFCCIYAYAENARGARYRMRSPENVVEEMTREYHERGVRLFVFHDDNFFVPHAPTNLTRYRRFAELVADADLEGIGLVLKCRPNDVDRELFALLKSVGLIRAYIGIETNSDEGIVSLNRRITSDDNRRALATLRELDLYHSFNMLIFDPAASLRGVLRNVEFLEDFADTPFNFCRAEVYAGTPLKKLLELEGRLSGDYFAWGYAMRDPAVELLFRITTTAFFARNFKGDGVANLNMGLRFDGEVFRRFYPQTWDRAFGDSLAALSRGIGIDTTSHLRRALDFVSAPGPFRDDAVKAFTRDLARAVMRADLAFLGETKRLRREMERRITAAGGAGLHNRFSRTMPPWAAESLRLGTSVGLEASTELLPLPSGV